MGLFSSDKPAEPSTPQPPNRSQRALCWEARDLYFGCLDKNNIIDPLKNEEEALKACGKESKRYEKDCAASWVKYFKQRRVMEKKKEEMINDLKKENAEKL
ncbi:hypothetical protein BJ508DRAFT_410600 [Ascobolus immersus RN42]|uniref:Cytochrome c oxidase, subunit VIb n=1 Tax=Ascobolus immersus RN42 TaxID=1160509 RepID=A0A3N4IZE2_ASCIM|nr:hypothetical protein BJ508DRAFT_410600 [Ascobolus immersus RN42]